MNIEIKTLQSDEVSVLSKLAPRVFDDPIDEARTIEFLTDPRHHLVVAIEDDFVVGFVSAVDYIHPDKPNPELWINEVNVVSTHRGRGIAKDLLAHTLELGERLGCSEAWVLTDRSNEPAVRLYRASGGEGPCDQVLFSFPTDGRSKL